MFRQGTVYSNVKDAGMNFPERAIFQASAHIAARAIDFNCWAAIEVVLTNFFLIY